MRAMLVLALFAAGCGGRQGAPKPITCEQVADRAIELIMAGLDTQFAHLTPEERAEGRKAAEAEAPNVRAQLVSDCNTASWSQADRQCVLDAQTVEAASACGQ